MVKLNSSNLEGEKGGDYEEEGVQTCCKVDQ